MNYMVANNTQSWSFKFIYLLDTHTVERGSDELNNKSGSDELVYFDYYENSLVALS